MKPEKIIIKHLHSMGFETEKMSDFCHMFSYEETKYLYLPSKDDNNYLQIVLPIIYRVTNKNRVKVLEALVKTTHEIKFSKMSLLDEGLGVWACYEHYLTETENLTELLEHILKVLKATAHYFLEIINCQDADTDEEVDSALEKMLQEIDDEEFETE